MGIKSKVNTSLSGRAVLYTVGQLSLNFLSVISAPIFVRLMTTSEYGMAAVYFTWVSILSNIVGLRADSSIQNGWSEFGEKNLNSYVSSICALSCCFFFFILTFVFAFGAPLARLLDMSYGVLLLCVVTSFFIACSNVRMAYCTVTCNATANMLISLVLSVSQIAMSIVLLMFVINDGYLARIAGYSIPTILIGLAFLVWFYRNGKTIYDRSYWRFCLALSLPLILNGIAYLLINQCDRLMLNAIVGPDCAGIYSFAYSCALPASVVCSAMNSAWTPEYFKLMKDGDFGTLAVRSSRYMNNMTLVSAAIMLVSPEVLKLLGTSSYYEGIAMLPLIVMAYYFQYLYTWPVNCEFYYKQTSWMTVATIGATLVNVALNLVLIPRFTLIGASLASLIAFIFLMVFHHVIAGKKTEGYCWSLSWYMKRVLPMFAVLAITYVFIDLMVARWLLALSFGAVLLALMKKNKSLF